MPIVKPYQTRPLNRDEYHDLDYRVMAEVFNVHNGLGCLHDEVIYQNELIRQLSGKGFGVAKEVPVKVSFESFVKMYFMDLVLEGAVIYELKACNYFCAQHRAQVLNYLMLTGAKWGKLVNFGCSRVESEYVTSEVSQDARWEHLLDNSRWHIKSNTSVRFRDILLTLIQEWGCFLDIGLFSEAIIHFWSGSASICRHVECYAHDNSRLGMESMPLLDETTSFHITAQKKSVELYREHLRRKMIALRLKNMLWVNFAGHAISFEAITI